MVERYLACDFIAKTFCKRLTGHVHPAPYARDFFPRPRRAVPKIAPVDVIHRGALVFDFLHWRRGTLALLNVRRDADAIILKPDGGGMRLVSQPCRTTTAEKPILDAMAHRGPVIGVMLNFKINSAFDQLRGYAAHRIVVAKAAANVGFRQFGVHGRL